MNENTTDRAETADHPDTIERFIDQIYRILPELPESLRKPLEEKLNAAFGPFLNKRPPRVMLLGRRGAGKSTFLNAMFGHEVQAVGSVTSQTGQAAWQTFQVGKRSLDILDTRGLQEGSAPDESDSAATAPESVIRAIKKQRPDIVLFLCKAKEVDAAIHGDLAATEAILREATGLLDRRIPLIGVVTQVDELSPSRVKMLPTDSEEKNANIQAATALLKKHLESNKYLQKSLVEVIPTAAYARLKEDGTVDAARDYRWNIDYFMERLLEYLPLEAQVVIVGPAKSLAYQKHLANNLVFACAAACGVVATQPMPMADMPILTAIQGAMVALIAYISGREVNAKTVGEFVTALGANVAIAYTLREAVRWVSKLVPAGGSVLSAAVASQATNALGKAAIAYFIDKKDVSTVREMMKGALKREG